MSSRSLSDPGGHSTLQFHAHQRQRCFWNFRPACKYPQPACEAAACMQLVQRRRDVRVGRTRVRGGFGYSKARTERQACRSVLQSVGVASGQVFPCRSLEYGFCDVRSTFPACCFSEELARAHVLKFWWEFADLSCRHPADRVVECFGHTEVQQVLGCHRTEPEIAGEEGAAQPTSEALQTSGAHES